jgi:hypothetical protein
MYRSFIALIFFCVSCTSSFKSNLQDADKLTITFFGEAVGQEGSRVVETENSDAIQRLANFIDGKTGAVKNCRQPSGFLQFSKGSTNIQRVDFYLDENCRFFVFPYDNKIQERIMSHEAVDFMNALKTGAPVY